MKTTVLSWYRLVCLCASITDTKIKLPFQSNKMTFNQEAWKGTAISIRHKKKNVLFYVP